MPSSASRALPRSGSSVSVSRGSSSSEILRMSVMGRGFFIQVRAVSRSGQRFAR